MTRLTILLLLVDVTTFAHGKSFLESGATSDTELSDMLATLLAMEHAHAAELGEVLRTKPAIEARADSQAALKSMFASLPHNEHGNLDFPAARYALHRLYEQRHRWFVLGLHPKTTMGIKAAAVGKAFHLLASADQKGVSLPSLATLAVTLQELIRGEVAAHLAGIYAAYGASIDQAIPGGTLAQIVDAYMTIYISGADFANSTKENIATDGQFMAEYTKDWKETRDWVGDVTFKAAIEEEGCRHPSRDLHECSFEFNSSMQIVKKVVESYGHFNDRQCHSLKSKLLEMEEHRTGRVALADFYKAGLSGTWEFNEKVDYLRSLGALDESTKDNPKVIVPNYVSSWVNCLSSSKFYSVCCRNECEDYLKVLEKHIKGPTADADTIVRVVETDPAFLVDSPPNLALLRHRLVGVAGRHGGKIPIHGRLFAQWMHHAFPRSCPYPHESGKTNPQTPNEWMAETGHSNIKASDDEVQKVLNRTHSVNVGINGPEVHQPARSAEIPWSDVEEVFVVRPTLAPKVGMGSLEKSVWLIESVLVVACVVLMAWIASYWRRLQRSASKKERKASI